MTFDKLTICKQAGTKGEIISVVAVVKTNIRTTTSFSCAFDTFESSQYIQPFELFTYAVSSRQSNTRHILTMTTTQCSHVIADRIQIILERTNLDTWVGAVFYTSRLSIRDITGQVQLLDREDDGCFRFVPKYTVLCRESFELDKENRWESSNRQGFGRPTRDFTTRAVPSSTQRNPNGKKQTVTHHASSPSITSDLTNSSISS
jgi:hypothetical protein